MLDRLDDAIALIAGRLNKDQLKIINAMLNLNYEIDSMDYNDWNEYFNDESENGLEAYVCRLFDLEFTPKKKNETITVVVYSNEITGVFADDFIETVDMFDIEVSREILFEFFKDECLEDFRNESDDKDGLTNEGYFEDWLNEYTADDTVGLWDYAKEHGANPLICGSW